MKKRIFFTLLTLAFVICFSSCIARIDDQAINGVIVGDIEKIDVTDNASKNEQNNIKEKESDENQDQVNVTANQMPDALSFIQSLSANVREEEIDADKIACEFLTALQDKDVDSIASLCGGKAEYYDFVKGTDIEEYVVVPFEIPGEVLNQKSEEGYYTTSNYLYAVSLKISSATEQENNPFGVGNSLWCLFIDTDAFLGYNVMGFIPYDLAENKIFGRFEKESAETFIHMLSVSRFFERLEMGRNDACDFGFKDDVHFVTHLTAWIRKQDPPFSINEMNEVLSNTLDGNRGVEIGEMMSWPSIWQDQPDIDYTIEELYTNFDIKAFGCNYAHGGTTLEYCISKDEKKGTERTVTVEYYSDFANLAISKICVFHFDESGESPNLLGVELTYDSGNLIAGVAV